MIDFDRASVEPLGGEHGLVLGAFEGPGDGREITEWVLDGSGRHLRATVDGPETLDERPFRTRMIVDRPIAGSRSDVVVVEWLNVTVGSDHAFDRVRTHVYLRRAGITWVGITAQHAGIETVTGSFGRPSPGLREENPDRYATLHHPGDEYAHDVFATAVATIRSRPEVTGGPVATVLATGHSQSASLLARHLVDVEPWSGLVDGYLIHGRGANAPELHDPAPPLIRPEQPVTLLPNAGRAKALQVLAETDVVVLGAHRARQDDDEAAVTWEVAGGAHVDTYLLRGADDPGTSDRHDLAARWEPSTTCFGERLDRPMNSGPQRHVLAAALHALTGWVRDGIRPHEAPRLRLDVGDTGSVRPRTDAHGVALGGLRTPAVDAGVTRHRGVGNTGPMVAYLCGTTEPIDSRPPPWDEVAGRAGASRRAAIDRGHLLDEDAAEIDLLTEIEYERAQSGRRSDS